MKTVCVLCALVVLTGCQPKPERYRIIMSQGSGLVIKVDTETGETWQYQSGIWVPIRTP